MRKVEVFQNFKQLEEFIEKAKSRENAGKKMYFGIIPDKIAELVEQELSYKIKDFNCALYSDNIRKIFKDHGDEAREKLRGQRAVINVDLVKIPEIIGNPDEIVTGGFYNTFPVINEMM